MYLRRTVIAALACLFVTGCATAPLMHTTDLPIPVASQTQLAGATLKSALLPVSDFPAGYQVDAQDTWDSGTALLPGSPSPASSPAPRDCQKMMQGVMAPTAGLTGGVVEVLYDAGIDHPSSDHQRRYGQGVYQFGTAPAGTAFFELVRSVFSRCPSVTSTSGATATVTRQTVSLASPVAGHQAILVRQTTTVDGVNGDSVGLYTIDGTDVYEVAATVFGVPLTAQPSSLAALTAKLIARVRVYECALACKPGSGS